MVEKISNWLKLHDQETVSHTWIYQHIARDKKDGGELHNHMRRGNYSKGHKEYKGTINNRISMIITVIILLLRFLSKNLPEKWQKLRQG